MGKGYPLHASFRGMTLVTIGFCQFVPDIHRMYKVVGPGPRRDIFLLLGGNQMTEVTVLGNDSARR